jgi:hypothetical protein
LDIEQYHSHSKVVSKLTNPTKVIANLSPHGHG